MSHQPTTTAPNAGQDRVTDTAAHPWWRPHKWGRWQNGHVTFSDGPDGAEVTRAVQLRDCSLCGRRQVREPIGATFYG